MRTTKRTIHTAREIRERHIAHSSGHVSHRKWEGKAPSAPEMLKISTIFRRNKNNL